MRGNPRPGAFKPPWPASAHTAMLGDKLLTDCLAAKRAGVLALTVEPVGGAVTLWQRVLHAMQAPFKTACRRRMAKKVKK